MDISYKGIWGYQPLVVSLANTAEPLYIINREGNRPSHEGAPEQLDKAIQLCRKAGFKDALLRGDTDFSLTTHFDRWSDDGVRFVFGYDAIANMKQQADQMPENEYHELVRRVERKIKTQPRLRPQNVKKEIIKERGFKNIRLNSEDLTEFSCRPFACEQDYRAVAVRKNLSVEKGQNVLFDDIRYFFYITYETNAKSKFIGRPKG